MITKAMLEQLREFITTESIDDEWLMENTSVECGCNILTITVTDMNDQEIGWIKDEMLNGGSAE